MIAGKTPFHGENHIDLLNNIKQKAVRLPPDVRVSKECVNLLRILLDRKPHTRADFKAFYDASEAFVALGCNGTAHVVQPANLPNATNKDMIPLSERMDLCAISENDGAGESCSEGFGTGSLATVSTLGTINQQQEDQTRQQPTTQPPSSQQTTRKIPKMGTAQANSLNALVRQDHVNRPGVVTPPFNPMSALSPSPSLPNGFLQGGIRQAGRPSVFAPLQGSPNLPPSATSNVTNLPLLSLQDGGGALPPPRTGVPIRNQDGTYSDSQSSKKESRSSSSQEASDSGFVIVEHSGCRSRPGSGRNSPLSLVSRAPLTPTKQHHYHDGRSPSVSPSYASSRVIVKGSNVGMLGTSPATGQALVGKMLLGSPSESSNVSNTPMMTGRFNVSPRSARRNGGCLAHIEALARILAASEDIGRRAITVAHLGDVRAYLAMELLVVQREGSQTSSSCTPMEEEGHESDNNPFASGFRSSSRTMSSKKTIVEEDEEEDELPFAMTTSMDDGSGDDMAQSPSSNIMPSLAPLIENNNKRNNELENIGKEEVSPVMIQRHFREALVCYLKTLSMMKGSISAAQKVLKEVDEVTKLPTSHTSPKSNNPYTPLKKRCSASLEWLRGQFSAVLERADAASEQIAKLQRANRLEVKQATISVEELIYNHSLKCGQEGAVKQLLGHYDTARSCYRSAGLLAETLLMEPKIVEEDRERLEGLVHSFADQIMELDGLLRIQMRNSRTSSSTHGQSGNVSGVRRQSGVAATALTSL